MLFRALFMRIGSQFAPRFDRQLVPLEFSGERDRAENPQFALAVVAPDDGCRLCRNQRQRRRRTLRRLFREKVGQADSQRARQAPEYGDGRIRSVPLDLRQHRLRNAGAPGKIVKRQILGLAQLLQPRADRRWAIAKRNWVECLRHWMMFAILDLCSLNRIYFAILILLREPGAGVHRWNLVRTRGSQNHSSHD